MSVDVAARRRRGHDTEVAFCLLAEKHGRVVAAAHPSVIAKIESPAKPIPDSSRADVILRDGMGGFVAHEIKGKYPTRDGCYGLEDYRLVKLMALTVTTRVYYTIFDTESKAWVTAMVPMLARLTRAPDREVFARDDETLYGGEMKTKRVHYWKTRFFSPLEKLWPR